MRHAQDVETPEYLAPDQLIPRATSVSTSSPAPQGASQGSPTITVPSGFISIDPDEEALIEVRPGRFDLSVSLSETPHAE